MQPPWELTVCNFYLFHHKDNWKFSQFLSTWVFAHLSQNNVDLLDVTMVCDDCAKQVVGDGQTHGQTISLGPKYCFPGTQIQFPRDPNTISQGPKYNFPGTQILFPRDPLLQPMLATCCCSCSVPSSQVLIAISIWKETWNFMFAGNLKSYLKLSGRTRTLRVT